MDPIRFLIWGGGGHGKVIADLVRASGRIVAGFVDADPGRYTTIVEPGGARVTMGQDTFLAQLREGALPDDVEAIAVAIGDCGTRLSCMRMLDELAVPPLVHPAAVVSPSARIGRGTAVFAGAIVNAAARIGEAVIINTGAVIEHDCVIEDGAHISPGAVLAGGVSVGRRSWIGAGASVIPGVRIGSDVTVGAGAVVLRDVPDGAKVAGVPARSIQAPPRSPGQGEGRPLRVYLSAPHIGPDERALVAEAFATNWIAPLGPHVDAFEREFCEVVGVRHAAALSSGTAALHLALKLVGVGPGDEVLVSTLTFAASVNPILYLGGRPVFIDSERESWNLDPALLAEELERRSRANRLPKALVLVHLYGQSADLDPIVELCDRYGVILVEDAAEALGSTYKGRSPGTLGRVGIYSFNGNKIITTSGGGMLVSDDEMLVARARKLATQARDPAPHYEHLEIGYNYRLSNVLAGIGRGQLRVLEDRVAARRRNFEVYRDALGGLPGFSFMPEAPWGRHTRWLTTLTIDPAVAGVTREEVRLALEAENIEARPVWKPMHRQPVFSGYEAVGGEVAEELFERGLCLPSGSNLTRDDLERVVAVVRSTAEAGVAAVRGGAAAPRTAAGHRTRYGHVPRLPVRAHPPRDSRRERIRSGRVDACAASAYIVRFAAQSRRPDPGVVLIIRICLIHG